MDFAPKVEAVMCISGAYTHIQNHTHEFKHTCVPQRLQTNTELAPNAETVICVIGTHTHAYKITHISLTPTFLPKRFQVGTGLAPNAVALDVDGTRTHTHTHK